MDMSVQERGFDHKRFLPGGDQPTSSGYIPFGIGSHFCIGKKMAVTQMKVQSALTADSSRI